jgi:hypothetical protein
VTSLFKKIYRRKKNQEPVKRSKSPQGSSTTQKKEEGTKMKKFGFATIIASGLTAAFLGLAGPASAGVDHLDWLNNIHQSATSPQVNTSVQQSR